MTMMLIMFLLSLQLRRRLAPSRQRGHPAALPMRMICFSTCKYLFVSLEIESYFLWRNYTLICSEEGFLEPPSKKAKTSSSRPTPAASEAPALSKEVLAPSSLPKEKENPSASGGHVSITTHFSFIVDDGSPSSSPRVYIRLLAIECRIKGVWT
jgi:hypothetical protein